MKSGTEELDKEKTCRDCEKAKDEFEMIERLRVTRQLTSKEYRKLLKHEEENNKELTAREIATMFNF